MVAATHTDLDETVALKLLAGGGEASAEQVARFMREAKAAAKIKSEHVARVTDIGRLDSGEPFIVMEYLDGEDLGEVVAAQKRLPLTEAVNYIIQACEAMAEAHAAGIVHRDLKPENLFLAKRSDGSARIKVLDFGISKTLPSAGMPGESMTSTGSIMGSPGFMAPEQWMDAKLVNARADIYALGAILFLMLSGDRPFRADSMPMLCRAVMSDPAPDLAELVDDLPAEVAATVAKALAKEPDDRHANVAELASELVPFASRHCRELVRRMWRLLEAEGMATTPAEFIDDSTAPPRSANGTMLDASVTMPDPDATLPDRVAKLSDDAQGSTTEREDTFLSGSLDVPADGAVPAATQVDDVSATTGTSKRRLFLAAAAIVGVVAVIAFIRGFDDTTTTSPDGATRPTASLVPTTAPSATAVVAAIGDRDPPHAIEGEAVPTSSASADTAPAVSAPEPGLSPSERPAIVVAAPPPRPPPQTAPPASPNIFSPDYIPPE